MEFLEKIKEFLNPLDEVFKTAGIAGLGLTVLIYVFRDIIRKSIFPTLTKLHGYKIIRLIILCTFFTALFCIAAFVYITRTQPNLSEEKEMKFEPLKLESKGVELVDSIKKKK